MQINIQDLTMTYPNGRTALKDICLELGSPSLIGLLGPNGAGKSTLMKLLVAGLLPTSGSITVDHVPLLQRQKQLKAGLGYLPQSFGLYEELTVWQFLDYMAALKGIRSNRDTIEQVIKDTGLTEKTKSRIHTLSGGQRQRVGIAQALLGDPQFLIFDEPTVGLDPEERIRFRNLFSRTAQDKLVILSTHIIEDVQSVCGQLVVMDRGRILFSGRPETLIETSVGHVWGQSKDVECPGKLDGWSGDQLTEYLLDLPSSGPCNEKLCDDKGGHKYPDADVPSKKYDHGNFWFY